MKNFFIFVFLLLNSLSFVTAQDVIITGIMDGTLTGGKPKVIELYVVGTADLSNYTMERSSNGDPFDISFSLSGTYTDQFVYLIGTGHAPEFEAIFGTTGDYANVIESGTVSGNGDDGFRILLNGTVIDQVWTEDTGDSYRDGYWYRNNETGPDAGWDPNNWTASGNDALDGLDEAGIRANTPFGTYMPAGAAGTTVSVAAGTNPAEPATDGNFTLTLGEPAPAPGVVITYTLSGSAVEGTDYTDPNSGTVTILTGGTTIDVTMNIIDDTDIDPNETIILTLQGANQNFTVSSNPATLTIMDDEPAPFTPIYTIQGSGASSPSVGQNLMTQGIVTSIYTGTDQFGGFFIQDATGDGNPATSDGIFVFCDAACPVVSVGDEVSLTGDVVEFFDRTELQNITGFTILSSGNTLPTPASIMETDQVEDYEPVEGMLVTLSQTLYVTSNFNATRFGEIELSANSALVQATQTIDPNDSPADGTTTTGTSNVAAVQAQVTANANNRIILDDGQSDQNPTNLPFFLNSDNTIRLGSTVTNLTGIMNYSFSNYKIEPLADGHPLQSQTISHDPRPAVPTFPGADLVLASFNVLNFFNGDGQGNFPGRGADNAIELQRQTDKIVAALSQMNADVVGLIELEVDGIGANSSIQELVDALNAVMGAGTYNFIDDSSLSHPDAIRNAIIYKPATVTPVGAVQASTDAVFDRLPVTQEFTDNVNNTNFVMIVNHFKSKGGCNNATGLDQDQGDGQACFNDKRKQQSAALLTFINSLGTDANIISVGDYNAYAQEDPIDLFRANGLTVFDDPTNRSFVFIGESGALDHAVVNDNFNSLVIASSTWNINADEPRGLDYNTEFNQAALYVADAFRSSDHNPFLVGIATATLPLEELSFTAKNKINGVELTWQVVNEINMVGYDVEWSKDGQNWEKLGGVPAQNKQTVTTYNYLHQTPETGLNYYRIQQIDSSGEITYSKTLTVTIETQQDIKELQVYPNPAANTIFFIVPPIFNINQNVTLVVYDHVGRITLKQTGKVMDGLQVTALPAGVYYIDMIQGETQTRAKFVKQN